MANNNLPSNSNFGNISHIEKDNNYVVKGNFYQLPFYKKNFFDSKEYIKFIKATEKIVRTSDYYKDYISYIKSDIGLNFCSIFHNINDDIEKADIEMHHGPILTLFDYCDIIACHMIANNEVLTTFTLANRVIDEHFENNVQVVMLSKTAHQLVHAGKIFIHPKQAFGNLNRFLSKYISGLDKEQIDTINTYIDMSDDLEKSSDNGIFNFDNITNWSGQGKDMSEIRKLIKTNNSLIDLEDELFN